MKIIDGIAREKSELRTGLVRRRIELSSTYGSNAATLLSNQFFLHFGDTILNHKVAGYWPMKGEIDIRLVLNELENREVTIALPVMVGSDRPLDFRRWSPGNRLVRGKFSVLEPDPRSPNIDPTMVIVPTLGFDAAGNRLGYGGGYYDRTLSELRSNSSILIVGVAYDEQECDRIPTTETDVPLDLILTARRTISCGQKGKKTR